MDNIPVETWLLDKIWDEEERRAAVLIAKLIRKAAVIHDGIKTN